MIDALTVRALGAEFNTAIVGGRVQQVIFLSPEVLGLEVYANRSRHYVLASAESDKPRLLLVSDKLRSTPLPPTPFMLLVKKYVSGAFLQRVEVVRRERILRMLFDHSVEGISTLVIELVGNRSNLILLDPGGTILDAARRVTASANRVRTLEPRAKYLPPPPQGKADPLNLSVPELRTLLEKSDLESLAQRLVETIAGTSPLLARELTYRVSGETDFGYVAKFVPELHAHLTRLWSAPAEPSVAIGQGGPRAVAAFALTHLQNSVRLGNMSAALERFFGVEDSYEAVKAPLYEQLVTAVEKLKRRRESLKRELVPAEEIETLKQKGEMILGYQYEIEPGQRRLRAPVTETLTLDIVLNPELSVVENASRYFSEYRRARLASVHVPELLLTVENDITFAEQLMDDLANADSRAEIEEVAAEAQAADLIRDASPKRTAPAQRAEPRLFTSADGFNVLVGRSARQNDTLTFERAKPDDIWLHARGRAGAHVVIFTRGGHVPNGTLEFAASLAAHYSQGRGEGAVDVIYTERKNVHRISRGGAHPGLVTVRDERTIRVKPLSPERLG